MHSLTLQAIAAALAQNWEQAITLNQKILQENAQDIDALNRLAYAFAELGRFEEAQEIFERVLLLDPKNLIATKNLLKLQENHTVSGASDTNHASHDQISPSLFLEEPGKTKTCHLIRIAAKDVIGNLRVGYKVSLVPKNRSVAVWHGQDTCIGYLPDDVSFSLSRFMQQGCEYIAHIKSVNPSVVAVFIKETKKAPELHDIPSFVDAHRYHNGVQRISVKITAPSAISEADAPDADMYLSSDE